MAVLALTAATATVGIGLISAAPASADTGPAPQVGPIDKPSGYGPHQSIYAKYWFNNTDFGTSFNYTSPIGDGKLNSCSTFSKLSGQEAGVLNNANLSDWQTDSTGSPQRLTFQTDGNLVMFDESDQPVWASGTHGDPYLDPSRVLVLQSDGNLVIYEARWNAGTFQGVNENPLWSSGTSADACTNLARQSGATWSSATPYGTTTASDAGDGDSTPVDIYTDKWVSTASNKWLRVDLGANKTIDSIVVKHAGAGGESTTLNSRDFVIKTSLDQSTWSTVGSAVTGNTASVTTHPAGGVSARYVDLNISDPEQSAGTGGAARIYELEVYGQ